VHAAETDGPRRLVLLTFQTKLGMTLTDQLQGIFGRRLNMDHVLFGQLDQYEFTEGDMLLALTKSSLRIAGKFHPNLSHTFLGARCINQLYLTHILALPAGQNILVVNDSLDSTMEVVRELEAYELPHNFVPFHPGKTPEEHIDWVVTPDEEALVPAEYNQVINLGTRLIGLDTILNLKELFSFGNGLDRKEIIDSYFKTLVCMVDKQLAPTSNRYISNWLGSRTESRKDVSFDMLVAKSNAMQELVTRGRMLAVSATPVHVSGSIGAGKRRIARMIHHESPRCMHPFNALHCPSRPMDMLERELFGWEDGKDIYPGLLESSHLGTLCLEGLESLPRELQNRLIQVIQEQRLVRQGGKVFVPVDVCLITTSHAPLGTLYNREQISRELFLLLQKGVCPLPALSERAEDVEELVSTYLEERFPGHPVRLTGSLLEFLRNHTWEGDMQELFNVLSLMAASEKKVLDVGDLPYHILANVSQNAPAESETDALVSEIEKRDFLPEILAILKVYQEGKQANSRYGRRTVISLLAEKGISLTIQQLRLRLERLQSLGLIEARKGRAGSTISRSGEELLVHFADDGDTP